MIEEKLKESFILKGISYILLPVFIITIIFSGIILGYCAEYPEARERRNYYDTKDFANTYVNKIYRIYNTINSQSKHNKYYSEFYIETETTNIIDDNTIGEKLDTNELNETNSKTKNEYEISYVTSYDDFGMKYLVIDKEQKKIYTNVDKTNKTSTIQGIKEEIISKTKYWSIEDKKISTDIEKINQENIIQDVTYEKIIEDNIDMYTSYTQPYEKIDPNDKISVSKYLYETSSKYFNIATVGVVISIIGAIITCIYLIVSSGHKNGVEGIYLDWFDKIPLEILLVLITFLYTIEGILTAGAVALVGYAVETGIVLTSLCIYIIVISSIYIGLGIIKRIKAKQLIKNSLFARIVRFANKIWRKSVNNVKANTKLSTKITILFVGFIAISGILIGIGGFGIVILLGFWIYSYIKIIEMINGIMKIKSALKSIYEGNTDIKLEESELKDALKEMAIYINDIAGGFSNAVQESLKSERMKTELITNVSHDIKTPLTSIINYVDLLKSQDIQDETAKEYIEILDSKSQRLKKLIEDLVEASKASSGNLKLEKQLININELIKQVAGEFEDKFKEKGLELIADYTKDNAYILADNRYIYRIIENLYSNVTKYALENSRVYVDIKKNKGKLNVAIKNISKERLNISTEELMQRFVRGDTSRNTEGSGLRIIYSQKFNRITRWNV